MYNKKILSSVIVATLTFFLIGCSVPTGKNFEGEIKTSSNISEKVNNEMNAVDSGLLLGLRYDDKNSTKANEFSMLTKEYRTLWIYHNGDKIVVKEKDKSIVVPYKDKFYEVKNDYFQLSKKNNENAGESFYSKYNFYYSWNSLVSKAIGEENKPLYTEESFRDKYIRENDDWLFKSNVESMDYIGNNYACINSDYYETGGGTYRSGKNDMKLFDIANLSNINNRGKVIKLYDLLEEDVKEELKMFADKRNNEFKEENENKDNSFIKLEKVVDIDNLSLTRKEGKWIIQIPIFEKYSHEGNGSNAYKVLEYIPYVSKLPVQVTSYDSLALPWDNIKKSVPEAIDAMSSPKGELMSVTTKDELLIFINPKEGMKEPAVTIPLNNNEIVVSNQWATGSYVEKWSNELGKLFK